ncbi:hypothetical protein GP486_003943 [Trichoglossum hirsutum]|uniref:Uncharacterized protein n=1 Tax=Trichoglossum hirsutum TaxID=265104 RepID=A0A9P8RPX4_9PEZI|nr:hypothetical protein GP486_003943 [Trichoglossum hirsutum]
MAANRGIAAKIQLMAKLDRTSRLNMSVNATHAPGSDGSNHPFDVVGTAAITLHAEAFRNIPSVADDLEDTPSIPTQDEIDRAVCLPTLDSLETNVENFCLSLNSANESLLVDEVVLYPKRRVDEMEFVGVTQKERLVTEPVPLDPSKVLRRCLIRATRKRAAINPRIVHLNPNPIFIHRPKERKPVRSGIGFRYRYVSDERDPRAKNRPPKRFPLEYPAHTNFKVPFANNAVVVPSSSSTPPQQIQTITKAGSNIRLAICILYRRFSNSPREIAAIVNRTFATGLSSKVCERILRGARAHKLEEYIDVYERTGWTEFDSRHGKVLRYLHRSAASVRVPLVPREKDIGPSFIRSTPTTSFRQRA